MSIASARLSEQQLQFYLIEQFRAWQVSVRALSRTHSDSDADFQALPEIVQSFICALVPIQLQILRGLPLGTLDGLRNSGRGKSRDGIAATIRSIGAEYHEAWVAERHLFRRGRPDDELPPLLKRRDDDAPWSTLTAVRQREAEEIVWAWCLMFASWADDVWNPFRDALTH